MSLTERSCALALAIMRHTGVMIKGNASLARVRGSIMQRVSVKRVLSGGACGYRGVVWG